MANGILYFSGTGNSLYIAQRIQTAFGGDILYIPTYKGNGSEYDRLYIVTPVYSFGMPKHVYKLLPRLDKNVEVIVIQNFGGISGGADYLMYEYCTKVEVKLKSVYQLQMPENFTTTFTVPKPYINSDLKNAEKRISKIINDIREEKFILPLK
ncbi:MAG: EFR1 family ferrodoxin, partial [Clostridia bacterium]|nr:EFR1 family ferrodoxin [Clostridia bacterium]